MNNLAFGGCNIPKDVEKLGACEVADFAPPQSLHSLHGKVFKEELIVPVGQFMRQFEEPIAATVDDALIDTRDKPAL